MKQESKSQLFLPFEKGGFSLKNRILMSPMVRSRAIGNLPNELMVEYYSQRATAGLIISESISPSPNGLGYPRIPGIFSDQQTEAWKEVTAAVHRCGGKIYAQLNHAGRLGSAINFPEKATIMGPSAIPAQMDVYSDIKGLVRADIPVPMTGKDIASTINEYVLSARNAITSGFDGVEIHSANGYLLEQFLNPAVNDREDVYGGSIENRCRLVIEVAQAVAEEVGSDRLGIRFSPYNTQADMAHYEDIQDTYAYLATEMKRIGLQYVHLIDTVTRLDQKGEEIRAAIDECFDKVRANFDGIIILNGGYTKEKAIEAIESGRADLISFGRLFISNPDLPYRLEHDLELTQPDISTFYTPYAKGYTDYSRYNIPGHLAEQ